MAARRLFTRLVSLGEGVEDTRRRIVRSEVDALGGSDGAVGQVIDTYGRHRLLSFDRDPASGGPTVEIAHEALLREWPRLRSWIDDDRNGLRLLRQISEAAAGWDRLGRGAGDLYRGARLLQALDWQAERPSDMSPVEAEFLAESRELRDSDERAEQERVAHRLRQNRRLRVALAVVAVALIGAIVAGTLAFDQRGEAKQQTELAVAEAARATGAAEDADQQAAIAQEQAGVAAAEAERADQTAFAAENGRLIAESASRVVDDRRIALLLAAEAHRRAPGVDSLGALQRTLTASTGFLGYLGSGPAYLAVDFTASDQLVAVSERAIDTWDTGERRLVGRTELAGPITAAALSPSASLAAILTEDGSTQVVDTSSDATIATGLQLDESPTTALVLSPDGGRLATGHADGTVLLWNVAGGTVEHTIAADVGTIGALAFSPDGTRLASGQTGLEERAEPGVRVWDVATAKPIGERLEPNPPGPGGFDQQFGTSALVFSSDGSTLTTVGRWAIRRWSLDTSEMLSDFLLPGADRTGPLILSFRQLNDDLAAGMEPGGGLTVFDVITGELIVDTVDTQLEPIRGAAAIAVSGDSSTLVVAGSDGLGLWSLNGRQALARQLRAVEGLAAASFDAAGERLVASAIFERPLIWDLTVDAPAPREFSRPGFWTQYHDSGSVLINLAADPAQGDPRGADIPRWDILDPDTLEDTGVIFEDSPLMFLVEAIHRERGLLATSSAIWDLNTGAFLARLPVQRVDSFSRDGSRVTGVTPDGRALVFDTTSWEPVGDPVTSDGSVIRTAGYSPDGRFFFTADATGTITLRDPESHEPIGAPLVGHRAPLGPGAQFVYFSPESERLLSYSEDSEIILWNVETRQRIGGSWPADRPENVTAMSADGTKLLTVLGSDLLIWNLNTEEWYAVACRVAGRNFTRVEWEQLGPSGAEYAPTCPQWPLEQ